MGGVIYRGNAIAVIQFIVVILALGVLGASIKAPFLLTKPDDEITSTANSFP